jgi:hypothetical protein
MMGEQKNMASTRFVALDALPDYSMMPVSTWF